MNASLEQRINELTAGAAREIAALVQALAAEAATARPSPVVVHHAVSAPTVVAGQAAAPRGAVHSAAAPASATGGNVIDRLLATISETPGLRSEQLRAMLGLDRVLLMSALAALRHERRVRTKGMARAMTYFAAGTAAAGDAAPAAPAPAVAERPAVPPPVPAVVVATPVGKTVKKREWPTCSTLGCKNNFFGPSGSRRLCYQHYREAGGKHPGQLG